MKRLTYFAIGWMLLCNSAWGQSRFFNVPSGRSTQPCTTSTPLTAGTVGVDAILKCGLKGDFTHDDTAALQACLDANPVVSLPVPPAAYKLCGVQLNSNNVLIGNFNNSPIDVPNSCRRAWVPQDLGAISLSAAGSHMTPGDVLTLDTSGATIEPASPATATKVNVATVQLISLPTVSDAGSGGTPGACTLTGTSGTGTQYTIAATIGGGGTISSLNSISSAGALSVEPTADPVTSNCSLGGTPTLTFTNANFGALGIGFKNIGPNWRTPPSGTIGVSSNSTSGGTDATFTITYVPTVFTLKDPTSAIGVVLQNLLINGNKGGQGGQNVTAFNIDNTGAPLVNIPRHHLLHLLVSNSSGLSYQIGFQTRGTEAEDLASYGSGYRGMELNGSDSNFTQLDLGQSAQENLYVQGFGGMRISIVKAWFAGNSTANYCGIKLFKASFNRYIGVETQDNGGGGFCLSGSGVGSNNNYVELVAQGDNGSATAQSSVSMFLSKNNEIHAVCGPSNDIGSIPQNCINLGGTGNTNNTLIVTANNLASFPVGGNWQGNTVTLSGRNNTVTIPQAAGVNLTSGTATPFPTASYTYQVPSVTGALTLANPSVGGGNTPVGIDFCWDFTQDGSGGHAITLGNAYKSPGVISTTASTRTLACFKTLDGTTWLPTSFFTGM